MSRPLDQAADHLDRLTEETDPLERILSAHLIHEAAAQMVNDAVAEARAHGHTWSEVAEQLGITRQAAGQRFRQHLELDPEPPKLTRQQRRAQERARRGS